MKHQQRTFYYDLRLINFSFFSIEKICFEIKKFFRQRDKFRAHHLNSLHAVHNWRRKAKQKNTRLEEGFAKTLIQNKFFEVLAKLI